MRAAAPKTETLTVTLPVRFPAGLATELKQFCERMDRPYSRVIRTAIREYLDRHGVTKSTDPP